MFREIARTIIGAMSLPLFILTVDFFGIALASPSIGRDPKTSTTGLEWTVNAFVLGFASPLPAVGRLGDIIGRRKVLLIGTVIFAIGSALCGIAQNGGWLMAARCVQGLGASMYFPVEKHGVGIGFLSNHRSTQRLYSIVC